MRYKLRSSSKSTSSSSLHASDEVNAVQEATSGGHNAEQSTSDECSPPKRPRLQHRRRKKLQQQQQQQQHQIASNNAQEEEISRLSACKITDLPQELVLHIGVFLDSRSLLALLRTSKWFYAMLGECNPFWKSVCAKEELSNYHCLISEDDNNANCGTTNKIGWSGAPMRVNPPQELPAWKRVFLKGMQMRRNIWQSNYEGTVKSLCNDNW